MPPYNLNPIDPDIDEDRDGNDYLDFVSIRCSLPISVSHTKRRRKHRGEFDAVPKLKVIQSLPQTNRRSRKQTRRYPMTRNVAGTRINAIRNVATASRVTRSVYMSKMFSLALRLCSVSTSIRPMCARKIRISGAATKCTCPDRSVHSSNREIVILTHCIAHLGAR